MVNSRINWVCFAFPTIGSCCNGNSVWKQVGPGIRTENLQIRFEICIPKIFLKCSSYDWDNYATSGISRRLSIGLVKL